LTNLESCDTLLSIPMSSKQKPNRSPEHCWIFKCQWRATSIKLRVEANDLEAAYKKAEYQVLKSLGGASCLEVKCVEQVY